MMDKLAEDQQSSYLTNLLKTTDANWQMLMTNAPSYIMITDCDCKLQFINRTLEDLDIESVLSTSLYIYIPQDQHHIMTSAVNHVLNTGTSTNYEMEALGNNNQIACYSINVGPIQKDDDIVGLIFIATDITERKHAQHLLETRVIKRTEELNQKNQELNQEIATRKQIEKELRESERRYRTLAAMSPVGIFRTSVDGQCIYANECCAKLCGLSVELQKGSNWQTAIHPDDRNRVATLWSYTVKQKIPFKTEYRFLHHDNSICWVLGEATPEFDEHNQLHGFVGTITDITKLREAQAQVQQHQQELAHFSRLTTMSEMASGIAHELNQPLAAIVHYVGGCLTRLKTGKITDELINTMKKVAALAERAGEIIHRLKNFLRRGYIQKQPMEVNAIIQETVALLEPEIRNAQINLLLELEDELPNVFVDRIHIIQAILNIAHNAIEIMGTMPIKQRKLIIKSQLKPNNKITISIIDNGPGISTGDIEKIFDPFYSTKENGMGMGLSISRKIIETHNGNIVVNNNQQNGCEFKLTLPIYCEENDGNKINHLRHR